MPFQTCTGRSWLCNVLDTLLIQSLLGQDISLFILFSNIGNLRGTDKSLARPNFRCILFDGENISFDASFVIYIYI